MSVTVFMKAIFRGCRHYVVSQAEDGVWLQPYDQNAARIHVATDHGDLMLNRACRNRSLRISGWPHLSAESRDSTPTDAEWRQEIALTTATSGRRIVCRGLREVATCANGP